MSTGTDTKVLIKNINQLTNKFQSARQDIIDNHPNFDTLKDSRITVFTNCILTLDGTYICFMVREFELWEDEWWKEMNRKVGGITISSPKNVFIRIPTPKNVFIKGFDHFTITAYFSLLFNALENGFRSFYKSIFPSKAIPGFFFYVYKEILEELVTDQTVLTEYIKLINILRFVRNAETHTNGIHEGDDDEITWNGMTFIFKRGLHIDYGGRCLWEVTLRLSDGVLDILKQVVNSSKVIQEAEILDASYAWL
jgi:hypothetical protein